MAHTLELHFDPASDAAVRAMWASLEARGLRTMATPRRLHRPHVTLTAADRLSRAQASAAAEPLRTANDLSLRLGSVSVFPGRSGVLYLAVVPTMRLLRLHHEVQARLVGAGVDLWRHYLPDTWVPHCTLAQGLTHEQIATAVHAVKRQRQIVADVVSVGLVDTETGEMTTVAEVPHSANAD